MDSPLPPSRGVAKPCQRLVGLIALGACYGGVDGVITGLVFATMARFDLLDAVVGSVFGGVLGGGFTLLTVGALGGRKCQKLDRMNSSAFVGAVGTTLGGIAGISVLNLLELTIGRRAGDLSRIAEDHLILNFFAAAAGSDAIWIVSRFVQREKTLQWLVLGAVVAIVGCLLTTPATLPLSIGGAVAGFFAQPLLPERRASPPAE